MNLFNVFEQKSTHRPRYEVSTKIDQRIQHYNENCKEGYIILVVQKHRLSHNLMDIPRFVVVKMDIDLLAISQVIHEKAALDKTQTVHLYIGKKLLVLSRTPIKEIYDQYKSDDGHLYIDYSDQEVFG